MADERKKIFIETVEALFTAYPLSVPTEAYEFFEDYRKAKGEEAKLFTAKGVAVLSAMREIDDWITATSLGEKMDISGRSVAGTFKKLVNDGYVEKRTGTPASYRLTDLGKTCELKIEVEES